MNDLTSMKDFDEDLVSFRNFMNESFYADDFYMQSFISYTYQILDELAITDHLQTIPKIFKEMWEVLGESSLAFKNSITWIIETVKLRILLDFNSSNLLFYYFTGKNILQGICGNV